MRVLLSLVLLAGSLMLHAQVESFRFVTYNILNYNPNNIDDRHDEFRLIMNEMQPDILMVQEVDGIAAVQMFADSVMNYDSLTYSIAPFFDGPDSDIGLFYKTRIFTHKALTHYPTNLRDIVHHQLKTNLSGRAADTSKVLHVFGVHLKASSGSSNEAIRKAEVDSLNKALLPLVNEPVIVCGDFNIYSSTEPAYQALVNDGTGYLHDTINITGTWNTGLYAQYHTQSPRTTRFNGGANGGLDDRFDMILFSGPIARDSIYGYNGDMKVFGNDGQHYNSALTDLPNHPSLSDTIINALHYASDHLPVMASFYNGTRGLGKVDYEVPSVYLAYDGSDYFLINETGEKLEYHLYLITGQLVSHGNLGERKCMEVEGGMSYVVEVTNDAGERLLVEKIVE